MENTVLVYLIDSEKNTILLARKLRGIGQGKLNSAGGHVEADEMPREAAVREAVEEFGIQIAEKDLQEVATCTFHFAEGKTWSNISFITHDWAGEPHATKEMSELKWYSLEAIPYDEMWSDDVLWLPRALKGEYITAQFWFASDNESVAKYTINP